MAESNKKGNSGNTQTLGIEISDRHIEIFARRLLPEIKRFFTGDGIRKEYEDWQRKRQVDKDN